MRIWFRFALTSLLLVQFSAAEERWIRMRSPDFEIFSTTSERTTRDTLRQFEQVHSFFTQAMNADAAKSGSIRILVFGSRKEFAIYRPKEFAAAFYMPGLERDYIVLGGSDSNVFPTAVHEYVHLVVQHAGMNLPIWLNEGLAELYSTLKPSGKDILIGDLIPGRFQALLNEKWVPLQLILTADRNSPYYNETNKAGSLYNEGWALTHMLALSPAYKSGFSAVVRALRNGTPSVDALSNTYNKPLGEIERDLIVYLRGGRFQGALFPIKVEKSTDQIPTETAPSMDVKLTLADLIGEPGRESEVEKRLTELIAEDPQRPEPLVAYGYLDLRRRNYENARKDFQKAFELGSRNTRMLWDYGRTAAGENRPEAMRAFSRLLEDEPDRIDVRLFLAGVQLTEKQPQEALWTLRPINKVSQENAPRLFKLMAYAQLEAGDVQEARNAVQRWTQNAQSPDDREEADRFQKYLASARPGEKPAAVPAMQDSGPPRLSRRDDTAETLQSRPAIAPQLPSIGGAFVRLDCDGPAATVVLETNQGTEKLLIQDPSRVRVDGQAGRTVDLACGPQPAATSVEIEFEKIPNPRAGIVGFVRTIHFTAK